MTAAEERILGVIPARGGSKGLPRKNLIPLKGRPLIAYTADAVDSARHLTRVVVSTDDEEIAETARSFGLEVPFMRPAHLAEDRTPSLPVIRHALDYMEQQESRNYGVIVMLQPTCPLRTGSDIDQGIELLLDSGADSVVSVVSVGAHHPYRMKQITADGKLVNLMEHGFEDMRPRQELPPVYIRSGALYISRRYVIVDQNMLVGSDCRALVVPKERSVNIDSEADLAVAEYRLARMRKP